MFDNIKSSAAQLKKVTTITMAAMLTAINVVLSLLVFYIGSLIKVSFAFITTSAAAFLYGPFTAGIVGGISDILGFVIKPVGPYFPGWTFNAVLTGIIHGLFFYNKPVSLKRVILSNLVVVVFVNLLLGTFWLQVMGYTTFFIALPARILESALMLPFEILVMFALMKFLQRYRKKVRI